MASSITDEFTRPNAPTLGATPKGQPWTQLRGSSGQVLNGRAVFSQESPGALWVVNAGLGGSDGSIRMDVNPNDRNGIATYFRVIDANRWWRIACTIEYTTSSYIAGYTQPTYGYIGDGTYYYTPAGGWVYTTQYSLQPGDGGYGRYESIYSNYDTRVNAYLSRYDLSNDKVLYYQDRTVQENVSYQQTSPGGEPIYGYESVTNHVLYVEKCENGIVSRVLRSNVSPNLANVNVIMNKEVLTISTNTEGMVWQFSDPTHMIGTSHGIGSAETASGGSGSGVDLFLFAPSVEGGFMPVLML